MILLRITMLTNICAPHLLKNGKIVAFRSWAILAEAFNVIGTTATHVNTYRSQGLYNRFVKCETYSITSKLHMFTIH